MAKRIFFIVGAATILGLFIYVLARATGERPQVVLSDGRLFTIEAVTYGTNHAVGWNDWWLVSLRKFLPISVAQFLTPTRGQSRQTTDRPALVVWVNARDANGKYVDCQGVRVWFVDDRRDVYPANSAAHGAFAKGFNREAHIFYVFPRRLSQLKLQLCPSRSQQPSTVPIANPCRPSPAADWTVENLPATRRIGDVELTLRSLEIHTNGGPEHWWETSSLHWEPVFRLSVDGTPATNWEAPEWEAEDATGNQGQTLGLHEPLQKFKAKVYPKPEAVTQDAQRWEISVARLPTTPQGIQWNTNRTLHDASVSIMGLFPPGSYTFSEGQLTNSPVRTTSMNGWTGVGQQVFPGRWQWWSTHGSSNYTAFVRRLSDEGDQRIAVGLAYRQDNAVRTAWGRSDAGGGRGVTAFVFDTWPDEAQVVGMVVVLQEPLHARFVVRPTLPR